jgi:hypothetical protein
LTAVPDARARSTFRHRRHDREESLAGIREITKQRLALDDDNLDAPAPSHRAMKSL